MRRFFTVCSLKVTSAVLSCKRAEAFICSTKAPRSPLSLVYPFRCKQTWMLDGGVGAVTDDQPSNHHHVRPKKENGAAAVNAGGDLMNVVASSLSVDTDFYIKPL